jgi:hypothetical protein
MLHAAPASIGVAALLCAGAAGTPALAQTPTYDQAFVDAFAAACVPGRLSYEGTAKTALAAGWTEVGRDANPELDTMMGISEEAAADPETKGTFAYRLFSKPIKDVPHYLVVSRATFEMVGEDKPWAFIGCYLYNFDAAAIIDPAPVTALIGNPVAHSNMDMHISGYVWGPPPAMPRTGDTYLTFIPEVSQYKDQAGFSGLVLKFSTSEPDDTPTE